MNSTYSKKVDELMRQQSGATSAFVRTLLEEAYNEGYNDGLGVTIPTQAEFDKDHAEPNGYGEEDDWLVLSAELYTEDEAVEKFKQYMIANGWYSKDNEEEQGMMGLITGTIELRWVGYRRGGDDREPIYWLSSRDDTAPTFWRAWVVRTEP